VNPSQLNDDNPEGTDPRRNPQVQPLHLMGDRASDTDPKPGRALVWGLLAVGCALRLAQYLANRSVSLDESYLALNLIERSIGSLVGSLDYNQAAPVGFLALQRLAGVTLGFDERALRLVPLLASLGALFAFWPLARGFVGRGAGTLALAAFAVADPLIFYGSIGKQYSVDVAATVVLLLLAVRLDVARDRRAVPWLALAGAVVVWFSLPSVFVLTTIGGVGLATALLRHERPAMRRWLVCCLTWAGSFAVHFALIRDNVGRIQDAFLADESAYLGTSGSLSSSGVADILRDLLDRAQYLVGLEHTSSGEPALTAEVLGVRIQDLLIVWLLVLAALGLVALGRRAPARAALVAGPGLLAGLASVVGSYPLVGRTLLFAIPLVCLVLGEGASVLVRARARGWTRLTAVVAALALTPLLIVPAQHVLEPRVNQGMLDVLEALDRERRPGDALFVAPGAQYTLGYYLWCDCRDLRLRTAWPFARASGGTDQESTVIRSAAPTLAVGRYDEREPGSGIRSLPAERVWLLLGDVPVRERQAILREARRAGDVRLVRAADAPPNTRAEAYLLTRR
jgi:hypothetical protein